MTAAARLAALDTLPAEELCFRAETTLNALVDVMNQETTLLRAGHVHEAGKLTPDKARLAQDYVTFARSVQRQAAAPQARKRPSRSSACATAMSGWPPRWRKTCACWPPPAPSPRTC